MIKLSLAAVAFLLLAQDPKPIRNPWAGFPDGSWSVIETVKTKEGKSTTEKRRFTVRIEADGGVTHLVSKEEDKPAIFFEERRHIEGATPESFGGKGSKPQAVELKIGDRKIACDLTEHRHKDEAQRLETGIRVWRTKEIRVPYRELMTPGPDLALDPDVVRVEATIKRGEETTDYRFGIVELEAKLTLSGSDVTCAVEEGTVEESEGTDVTKGKFRRWLSDSVPGRVVRSEARGEVKGKQQERIEQVTAFKVMK
jgi:hypothetical protein